MTAWPSSSVLAALAVPASAIPWIGRLATLLMLALLAWVGATVFWTLSASVSALDTPPPVVAESDPQRAMQAVVNRHLFGIAPAANAPGASANVSNIRLIGVIAAQSPGKPAYAILSVEGKPSQVVREGAEVAQGILLQRVKPREVELLRGGQSQLLTLPERGKS